MTKPTITAEQHQELEQRTLSNIIGKIADGSVPTARELTMLRQATATPPRHTVDHWPEAELAEWLDLSRQRLEQLAEEGTIPGATDAGWPAKKCVGGYIRKLRERLPDEGKIDRARLLKAQASTAELEQAALEGTLSDRAQVNFDMKDTITRGAAAIGRLKTLTPAQKQSVLRILRETKLPPLSKT